MVGAFLLRLPTSSIVFRSAMRQRIAVSVFCFSSK